MRELTLCYIILVFVFIRIGYSQLPEVSVKSVNSEMVGLYEKFEIQAGLANVTYSNPYDPAQVDLKAVFTSPSGKEWLIFGFYDNYNGANSWKVRFSANEIGQWQFYLTVKTPNGERLSPVSTFNVTESDYHGWIRVSPVNQHYFIYDDGTPFYAVGPYFPWGVNNSSTNGLAKLQTSGCNFWGYWNIMYDTGEIIESINSGLGKYDQPKCGWIDQLINWSEERDLKMMLAIWPHDLLSNTVWAHQWHQNPYNTICSVDEFFESEEAWAYQEKQYRYIIARWGYSRALGIWEIVNEINGTDGWVRGKEEEARVWVGKVHDFLKANDPHQRPTTASQSGGRYWPEGYAEVDVPNVHVYETDWPAKYLGNPLRSSAYTYFMLANQFWNDFEKPAIFGEAGYTNSYGNFAAGSDEYTAMFHNALWASWAGGMAATPVWWSFTSRNLMTNDVMEQKLRFSQIAKDYNYAYQNFIPYEILSESCDVYAMRSDSSIFGWVRELYGNPVSDQVLKLPYLQDTSYQITWYNTWNAQVVAKSFIVGADSLVSLTTPKTEISIPDLAFFIEKTAEGKIPAQLKISTPKTEIFLNRNESINLLCTVHDSSGRFVRSAANTIKFQIEGPGKFNGMDLIKAENGVAEIAYMDDDVSGSALIIASSPGLIPDTLTVEISSIIWIDNFESYKSLTDLKYIWFPRPGTTAGLFLVSGLNNEQETAIRFDYAIGDGNAPYSGIHILNNKDFTGCEYLQLWLKGDASGRLFSILLNEVNGRYWRYDYVVLNNEIEYLKIPLSNFVASDTASSIKLDQIDDISFNILPENAEMGQGTIYLDDINFLIPSNGTGIENKKIFNNPDKFELNQNYPNPFNQQTIIGYQLPEKSSVELDLFDVLGQHVKRLVTKNQNRGTYIINFDAAGLATGVYYYRLNTGNTILTKKMLLLR